LGLRSAGREVGITGGVTVAVKVIDWPNAEPPGTLGMTLETVEAWW
jgi:hypothetical protein